MTTQSNESPEERDNRLYAQARKKRLTVHWSTEGDALVTSASRRPKRHRVRFDHAIGRAIYCPCESMLRCRHMILAEARWESDRRRAAREADLEGQLQRSITRARRAA